MCIQLDLKILRSDCSVTACSHRRHKEAAVNKVLGMILVALGLFGLAWGGFTYTTREKIVDIGPIHATREKTHDVPLPPIFGRGGAHWRRCTPRSRKKGITSAHRAAGVPAQVRLILLGAYSAGLVPLRRRPVFTTPAAFCKRPADCVSFEVAPRHTARIPRPRRRARLACRVGQQGDSRAKYHLEASGPAGLL